MNALKVRFCTLRVVTKEKNQEKICKSRPCRKTEVSEWWLSSRQQCGSPLYHVLWACGVGPQLLDHRCWGNSVLCGPAAAAGPRQLPAARGNRGNVWRGGTLQEGGNPLHSVREWSLLLTLQHAEGWGKARSHLINQGCDFHGGYAANTLLIDEFIHTSLLFTFESA